MLVLGAVLLVLPLVSTTSHAGDDPASMKWAGTVKALDRDTDGDGINAIVIEAEAKGSFGASSLTVLAEYAFGGICDSNPAVYYLSFWYARPVVTHQNGEQLWGKLTTGWKCMNMLTGDFFGEIQGNYDGGTGQFAGATGSFIVPFSGKTLTIPDGYAIGFAAITGEAYSTVTLP
jgi:hypothetical protein